MKRGQFVRWRNYQKVLMGVYWLADMDGLRNFATDAELAAETGLTIRTVRRYLLELNYNGVIIEITIGRKRRRMLVLRDHPKTLGFLKYYLDYWGPLGLQAERNRKRNKASTPDHSRGIDESRTISGAETPIMDPGNWTIG